MAALGRTLTIGRKGAGGTFTLACLTDARSFEINNEEIDITKPDCTNPGGKLVQGLMYGTQSVRFTGQTVFADNTTMKAIAADVVNQVIETYQVTVPGVGTFEGDCLVSGTFSGDKSGEMTADLRWAFAGDVAFEAAV